MPDDQPFPPQPAPKETVEVVKRNWRAEVETALAGFPRNGLALHVVWHPVYRLPNGSSLAAARADGKRALLIESDMRRPTLSGLIGSESVAGLAELLSHSQDLESGLRELVITPDELRELERSIHLDILLAGSMPPNPVELLESNRMRELLEAADAAYDLVIIDTPPIGVVSDAIPLIHQVDGLVVISRIGVSHKDHAVRLMKRFRSLNAHMLGVVVNSFRAGSDGASGGYYAYHSAAEEGVSPRRLRAQQRSRTP